ncbi:MAG: tetratricopeptide repeat protein [Candidatus Contendobacter sp.]|nr:tetratricopeptide repeat protein [Candidatus Contendobacter sp.]MDS4056975.1 tetratricopeptide repeat protein [Candidatus Contendobacter sp.]
MPHFQFLLKPTGCQQAARLRFYYPGATLLFLVLLFLLMAALTLIVYWPGLRGPFLLDDFANLDQLGKLGGVRNWETFHLYVFSNNSGAGGRPLSMLSFLLNDNTWPSDPRSFKYTNLLLHLLTGILLTWLIYRLLLARDPQRNDALAARVALLTAALWLLHPFNVSTTLYVVQRMAILSALFSIAGLLVYVAGRDLLACQPRRAYLLMTTSVVIFTPLAVFSKENGALLPLLIAVLEYTALRHPSLNPLTPNPSPSRGEGSDYVDSKTESLSPHPSSRWMMLFLGLPNLLIIGYLAFRWNAILHSYHLRPFTLGERLLTESRILCDYLQQLIAPNLGASGIFNENPALSHGLFDPPTTLAAILAIFILIAGAWILRARYPLLSLAVLFFFAGHLLESTFIPLELYFEHRNYLPAIFLFLPLTHWLVKKAQHWRWLYCIPTLFLTLFAFLTYQQAILWGDQGKLFLHWAQKNPYSIRAQRVLAMGLEARGRPDLALQHLNKTLVDFPNFFELWIHRTLLLCQYAGIDPKTLTQLDHVARFGSYDFRTYLLLEELINALIQDRCRGATPADAHRLLDALLENRTAQNSAGSKRQLAHLHGLVYLRQHNPVLALRSFQQSQQLAPDIEAGLAQVSLLASNGMLVEALTHLKMLQRDLGKNLDKASTVQKSNFIAETARLEKIILDDLTKTGQPMTSPPSP